MCFVIFCFSYVPSHICSCIHLTAHAVMLHCRIPPLIQVVDVGQQPKLHTMYATSILSHNKIENISVLLELIFLWSKFSFSFHLVKNRNVQQNMKLILNSKQFFARNLHVCLIYIKPHQSVHWEPKFLDDDFGRWNEGQTKWLQYTTYSMGWGIIYNW